MAEFNKPDKPVEPKGTGIPTLNREQILILDNSRLRMELSAERAELAFRNHQQSIRENANVRTSILLSMGLDPREFTINEEGKVVAFPRPTTEAKKQVTPQPAVPEAVPPITTVEG